MATDPQNLISLVYTSTAARDFDDASLRELLDECRFNNARRDITGMLLFRSGRFFQILEGPDAIVRDLIERIAVDPRHDDVRILIDARIDRREFAEWTMGYRPMALPEGAAPAGFRDTFEDLDRADEPNVAFRAARELSLWFRVRSRGA
jgi:hypothetical protein